MDLIKIHGIPGNNYAPSGNSPGRKREGPFTVGDCPSRETAGIFQNKIFISVPGCISIGAKLGENES